MFLCDISRQWCGFGNTGYITPNVFLVIHAQFWSNMSRMTSGSKKKKNTIIFNCIGPGNLIHKSETLRTFMKIWHNTVVQKYL
jgi:hypothetical protein